MANVDDSGTLQLTDPIYLLRQLFSGGAPVSRSARSPASRLA